MTVPRPSKTASKKASSKTTGAPRARRAAPADPEGVAYVDGDVLALSKARVPLTDRGYLLGDGVFETMRTSNGHIFRLEEHTQRMVRGLRAIGLDASLQDEFTAAVQALHKEGRRRFGDELYIRVMVTTGPMEDVLGTGRGVAVTGLCKRFKPYPMQYYARGVSLIVSKQRKDSRSPLSPIKTLSFLPYIAARREAHAVTAHDAVLRNEEDRVAEATTSNIFAIKDGTLYAPGESEGAIPGVTRAAVLQLVRELDLKVREPLTMRTLRSADECFLTNTTGGIVPVTLFDDRPVGEGAKGEYTTQLMHALEAEIRGADA
ncbi:MAG TPA: aminotransferase class IV [Candidatus Thermoplasmatota archaeon]|nr:aminotransferase class IV [Candidatus Thermoplasmatota archaeon]